MIEKLAGKKEIVYPILAALIVFFKRWALMDKGINYEEAKDIECFLKVANGEIPYKDFWWPYGPFQLYFFGFFFKWFNVEGFLFPRLVVSAAASAGAFFSYKIARFYLSSSMALLASLFAFSGLVANVHTYGHIFAVLGLTLTFYFLQLHIFREKDGYLWIAGGFCGLAIISKPFAIGASAFAAVVLYQIAARIFSHRYSFKQFVLFPASAAIVSTIFYLPLPFMVPFPRLLEALFPMFSGYVKPESSFNLPSIFPMEIFGTGDFSRWIQILNQYFSYDFRWWLVVLTFLLGGFLLLKKWQNNNWRLSRDVSLLLALVIFAPFFELQVLLIKGTSPYINMLPSFILLFVFLNSVKNKAYLAIPGYAFIAVLFAGTFVYSPIKYFWLYKTQGIPLRQKYAENILVTPYQKAMYDLIVGYIKSNTTDSDRIVVADYNSMFVLLSGRPNLFADHWGVFQRASFHPYNKVVNAPLEVLISLENKIVERIKEENPKVILIPTRYLTSEKKNISPFLKYLESEWERVAQFQRPDSIPGMDYDLGMSIFKKAKNEFRGEARRLERVG
ncbi:MAG: hypothetical protein ACE5GQ_03235 [Nitrospinales bacterium]